MRCTPVNAWKTRREPWENSGPVKRTKTAIPEQENEDDEVPLQKQENKRTYATSYDVAFMFEQLWKKKTTDESGNRIPPVSSPKSSPFKRKQVQKMSERCMAWQLEDELIMNSQWYRNSKHAGLGFRV